MKNSNFKIGALMSVVALGVNALAGILAYRILWGQLSPAEFSLWFSIFEIGNMFLLFDMGVSQKFIKDTAGSSSSYKKTNYYLLRSNLLKLAMVCVCVFSLILYMLVRGFERIGPFLCILFVPFFSILSYAETALLRVEGRFFIIYLISIFSSVVFILFIYYFSFFGIWGLALASVLRVFCIWVLQVFITVRWQVFSTGLYPFSGISYSSFFSNASHTLIFSLDGILFLRSGVAPESVANYLMHRKIFDFFKGVYDSIISIYFVKMTHKKKLLKIISFVFLFILISLVFVFLLVQFFLGFLLNYHQYDYSLSQSLSVFLLVIFLIRLLYFNLYFCFSEKWSLFYILSFILLKLISLSLFLFSYKNEVERVANYYYYSSLLLALSMVAIYFLIQYCNKRGL